MIKSHSNNLYYRNKCQKITKCLKIQIKFTNNDHQIQRKNQPILLTKTK